MQAEARNFFGFIALLATLGASLIFPSPALAADEHITVCKQAAGAPFSGTPSFSFIFDEIPGGVPINTALSPGACEEFEVAIATQYSITETALPADWSLTNATCNSGIWVFLPGTNEIQVTTALNDQITCTFTNTYAPAPPPPPALGSIQIATRSTGDAFSDGPDFDFTGAIADTLGPDETSSRQTVSTGAHSVSEGPLPFGWTLSAIECTSSLSPDPTANTVDLAGGSVAMSVSATEDVSCTFVHEYAATGTLEIDMITAPSGDPTTFDFTLTGASSTGFALADTSAVFASGPLPIGSYSIAEALPAYWVQTDASCDDGSDPASIGLEDGETVRCTFVNTKLATIEASVRTTDERRDGMASRAMFAVDGFFFTGALTGDVSPGGSVTGQFLPGIYSVTQRKAAGWQVTRITCSTGGDGDVDSRTATYTVTAGDVAICTFRNSPSEGGVPPPDRDDSGGSPGPQIPPEDAPPSDSAPREPLSLPLTGAQSGDYAILGLLLMLVGLVLTNATKKRLRPARCPLTSERATAPPPLSATWSPHSAMTSHPSK